MATTQEIEDKLGELDHASDEEVTAIADSVAADTAAGEAQDEAAKKRQAALDAGAAKRARYDELVSLIRERYAIPAGGAVPSAARPRSARV